MYHIQNLIEDSFKIVYTILDKFIQQDRKIISDSGQVVPITPASDIKKQVQNGIPSCQIYLGQYTYICIQLLIDELDTSSPKINWRCVVNINNKEVLPATTHNNIKELKIWLIDLISSYTVGKTTEAVYATADTKLCICENQRMIFPRSK